MDFGILGDIGMVCLFLWKMRVFIMIDSIFLNGIN